jgi:hypothetical protein
MPETEIKNITFLTHGEIDVYVKLDNGEMVYIETLS